jgi:hypothetical protein
MYIKEDSKSSRDSKVRNSKVGVLSLSSVDGVKNKAIKMINKLSKQPTIPTSSNELVFDDLITPRWRHRVPHQQDEEISLLEQRARGPII